MTSAATRPALRWVLIQSALSDALCTKPPCITPYYLTVTFEFATPQATFPCTLQNAASSLSYWMFTFDNANTGRIRSQLPGFVLSVDGSNNLIVEQEVVPTPPSQLWDLDILWDDTGNLIGCYELNNHQTQSELGTGYLAVNPCSMTSVSNGTSVSAGQAGMATNPAFQWCLVPNTLLTDLLSLPNYNGTPAPSLPPFTGDAATAYAAISTAVISNSGGDIRSRYTDETITGPSWSVNYTNITELQNTSGVSDDIWEPVRAQLALEIEAVVAVIGLRETFTDQGSMTAIIDQGVLSQMISDAGLSTTAANPVGVDVANFMVTVGLSILSATSPAGCVAAGVIQAAMDVDAGGSVPSPEAKAISELWKIVNSSYTATLNELDVVFNQNILLDWRRLSLAYYLSNQEFPVTIGAGNVAANAASAQAGVTVSTLQTLLPALFQIYVLDGIDYPDYASGAEGTDFDGKKAYIAGVDSPDTTFPSQLIADLTNVGHTLQELFSGTNGWCFPRSLQGVAIGDATIWTLTIANWTPNILTATLTEWMGGTAGGAQTLVIQPNSTAYLSGPELDNDPNNDGVGTYCTCSVSDGRNGVVASFQVNPAPPPQYLPDPASGNYPAVITSVSCQPPYAIPITYTWDRSMDHDTSASVLVTICYG